jgi:integrase
MPGNEITISPARDPRPAAAGGEVQRLVAAAAEYAAASRAPATRRAYQSAWSAFCSWCHVHGAQALPARGDIVALYLTELAPRLAVATLGRHLAAIRAQHADADEARPDSAFLRKTWSGIRRTHGRPPNQKRAALTKDLVRVVKRLPPGPAGLRDRALLLIGLASALRRSELAGLEFDIGKTLPALRSIRFVAGGVEIRLGRSKTDQTGEGQVIAVPSGRTQLCPVQALKAWLEAAAISSGPVFRGVDRHGRIGQTAMRPEAVAQVIKRAFRCAGFDPAAFAGHSLRSGFVTSAHLAGASLELIMQQTRHRKTESVMGYIRDVDRFKNNAARKLGL